MSWYTAAAAQAQVKLAFFKDQGKNFGDSVRLVAEEPLGRVDVKLTVLLTWVEQEAATMSGIPQKLVSIAGKTLLDGSGRKIHARNSENRMMIN